MTILEEVQHAVELGQPISDETRAQAVLDAAQSEASGNANYPRIMRGLLARLQSNGTQVSVDATKVPVALVVEKKEQPVEAAPEPVPHVGVHEILEVTPIQVQEPVAPPRHIHGR